MNFAATADHLSSASLAANEVNELLENVTALYTSLKSAAVEQSKLKRSLADDFISIDTIRNTVALFPKYTEENCRQLKSLCIDRIKVVSRLSNRIELQNAFYQCNCLLISCHYWLKVHVWETVGIIPYLIDGSLGLNDLHDVISAVDTVEKLILSGSLKELFVSATLVSATCGQTASKRNKRLPLSQNAESLSTMYTLLLDQSSSLTLSKTLNSFADVRAQLTSNKLIVFLQGILNPLLTSPSSANDSDGESGQNGFRANPRSVEDSTSEELAISSARRFQTECLTLIEQEVQISRCLIDCFSQSSGFVQALSKKSLRRTASTDTLDNEAKESTPSRNHNSQPRPKFGRRSKSVVWVDTVDAGVRTRLETAYSKWYFGRLKTAVLGRCLFALPEQLNRYEKFSTGSAFWSLDRKQINDSCDILLRILRDDNNVSGAPRELLGLVLSSALLRSRELQSNWIMDDLIALLQQDKLSFLEPDDDFSSRFQTSIGARFYYALTSVAESGPHNLDGLPQPLYDQLFKLQLSTLRFLIDHLKQFLLQWLGLFLARKNYSNFTVVYSEVFTLAQLFRTLVVEIKDFVQSESTCEENIAVLELLLTTLLDIDSTIERYHDLFVKRLSDDVISFLTHNMPTAALNWRKKTSTPLQKMKVGIENEGYVAFSVQPHPYAFSLMRSCFSSYSLPLLSVIFPQNGAVFVRAPNYAKDGACRQLFECVAALFMSWLRFILDKGIKFSSCGARQLEADFQNVQFLIDQQISATSANNMRDIIESPHTEFDLDSIIKEFRSLPIFRQLRSVVYVLISKSAEIPTAPHSHNSPDVQINNGCQSHRSISADSDQSLVETKATGRRHRRRRKGEALNSGDSEQASLASHSYPVPFGAEEWLRLVDDRTDNSSSQYRSRLFTSTTTSVQTVCMTNCVPWRRTSVSNT